MPQEQPESVPLRTRILRIMGPALCLLILSTHFTEPGWLFPGLDSPQRNLVAILSLVISWWIGEVLPLAVTGILGCVLAAALQVGSIPSVFAPFVHPLIVLFFAVFLLARGMQNQQLDRALSIRILGHPAIVRSPFRILLAIGIISGCFSAFISNTATVAMAVPIVTGLFAGKMEDATADAARRRFQIGALLMLAYASTLGGLLTPIGTPPNAISLGYIASETSVQISFLRWFTLAAPVTLLPGPLLLVGLWWLYGRGPIPLDSLRSIETLDNPTVRRNRWVVFGVFCLCVGLWLTPDVARMFLDDDHPRAMLLRAALPLPVPPLIAVCLLFLWQPIAVALGQRDPQPLLEKHDLRTISWETLFLFGSGLALGGLTFDTGLAELWGESLTIGMGVESVWVLTAIGIALAIALSEATSNTASASVIVPLMIGFAASAGVSPIPPALGAALGASFGFMMPVSTPPNAIIYGTGNVPLPDMMKAGVLWDIAAFLAILATLRLLCPLLGLV
jgi:sodium-dependent dicarboxylate transporter 2/3/5